MNEKDYSTMSDNERRKILGEWMTYQRTKFSLRERRTISQSEMARKIGISQATLSKYELGSQMPTGDNIAAIAAKYGPEVYDIVGAPQMMPTDPQLAQIARAWHKLSQDHRKRFLNLIMEAAQDWDDTVSKIAGEVKS